MDLVIDVGARGVEHEIAMTIRPARSVVGIVEDTFEPPPTTIGALEGGAELPEETVSRASPDVIPPSVMKEIEAMLAEVQRQDELDGWDVITEVTDKTTP